jgi:outer membrane receptor protein involved in Fe transport
VRVCRDVLPPLLVALIGSTALTHASRAQTPAPPAPAALGGGLEQIVVTAEKRSNTVEKTPISITVFTGAELQKQGISDFLSVAQQVPGLSFKDGGPGQTEFEMRGLTSTGGESPTVGFYLDEVALTPPAMAQNGKVVVDPDLFDLSRVEVLRGPQGTLYGAGSMGGTIRLITNQPDLNHYTATVEGIGSGTQGGGFNHTFNGMVNFPLVQDKLALRVVGTDKYIDGWIARDVLNPFPPEVNNGNSRGNVAGANIAQEFDNSNWEHLSDARATLLARPIDNLSITLGGMYQRIDQGGPNTIDSPPDDEVHFQPFNVAEPFSDKFGLADLTIKYDYDWFQVTSATAIWQRQQNQTQDISEAMQDYIGGFFGPPQDFPFGTADGGFGPVSITEHDYTRQISEEFRINSTGGGPFQWLIGTYYSHFLATSWVYSFANGFVPIFGTNNLADNHRLLTLDQAAGFAEISYQIFEALKATAGVRYYSYQSNSATSVSGISASGTSATLYGHATDTGFNPKFDLTYTFDQDLLAYVTAAQGFRPGGPNSPIPSPPCPQAPTEFGPDSVWSYELGEKYQGFAHRLTVNADIYYEDWSNLQQEVAPACGFNYTTNAGKATIYGAEVEVAYEVVPGLVLSQNGGYTNATNSTTVPAAGVTAGERLLDVPKYTANSTVSYSVPVRDNLAFVYRLTNSYRGSMQDITYGRNTLPSYDLINTRLGFENTQWSAYAFIDNLTNKKALYSDNNAYSANVNIFNRITTNQPRTIGVDLTYKF